MDELTPPSGVWTYPNGIGAAPFLYVPYLDRAESVTKQRFRIFFNGGDVEVDLRKVSGILFYGASGSLPLSFLDAANTHQVPITFHRTHIADPYVLVPSPKPDRQDLLTQQILTRQDKRTRVYVARTLIHSRIKSLRWKMEIGTSLLAPLMKARTLQAVRAAEATLTQRYWSKYYDDLALHGQHRRVDAPVNRALDAAMMLLRGVVLRWIIARRLSPHHGFLHEPTTYTSLAYDLIEPVRYIAERAVHAAASETGVDDEKRLIAASMQKMKELLAQTIYVPETRQHTARKALINGCALALGAYLSGEMNRLVLPSEEKKSAGRPMKVTYRLFGNRLEAG